METIKWVFSGVGVVVAAALARYLYHRVQQRRAATRTHAAVRGETAQAVAPERFAAPPPMLGAVTPSRIVRWINETRRIRVGDCADVPWPEQSIRIEVEDIRVAEIPDCYGQYRQAKICADKQVSIGGAVVYGGMSTTDHQVNRALLPRAESYEEPAASLFSFHASDRHFSFVGFIVTHINQHDHVVDVNVVAVRLFR